MHFSSIPQVNIVVASDTALQGYTQDWGPVTRGSDQLENTAFSPILSPSFQYPLLFPRITSQINYLHSSACLQFCFQRDSECYVTMSLREVNIFCLLGSIFKELYLYGTRRRLLKWILKVTYTNPLNASRHPFNKLKWSCNPGVGKLFL